jgi:hypothetical protein
MPEIDSEFQPPLHDWPGLRWPLPLVPFERYLLSQDSDASPMVFRVLLRFDGPVHRELLEEAYRVAVLRQPLLNCLVSGVDNALCWRPCDVIPSLKWNSPVPDRQPLAQTPIDSIDLRQRPGLDTRVWEVDDGLTILLNVHHCCCDGQGARQFLGEWLGSYEQRVLGGNWNFSAVDFGRLQSRGEYRVPDPPIGAWEGFLNLWRTLRGRTWRLPKNHSVPAGGEPDIILESPLSGDQTSRIRQHLKQNGWTINDVGLAAAMTSLAEFWPDDSRHGLTTILHPVDLRFPSDLRTPACNRVGITFLRRGPEEIRQRGELLARIHTEMQYIKRRYVGAEFLRGLATANAWPGLVDLIDRQGWFRPTLQFTCLGDTTRSLRYPFRKIDGIVRIAEMKLDRISGFMQLGQHLPLSITACETNRRLSLTFRARPDILNTAEMSQFSGVFIRQLEELSVLPKPAV